MKSMSKNVSRVVYYHINLNMWFPCVRFVLFHFPFRLLWQGLFRWEPLFSSCFQAVCFPLDGTNNNIEKFGSGDKERRARVPSLPKEQGAQLMLFSCKGLAA